MIECGTFSAVPMHAVLRDDHWLHLHGDPRESPAR
ncbi:M14 family metallopeptidase [Burkholderia sp. FL-7-2-10-S1-D7]|nr:M14 family metallopeptidase [Burkholderia sp. FL-7-2-10-S1-D7]